LDIADGGAQHDLRGRSLAVECLIASDGGLDRSRPSDETVENVLAGVWFPPLRQGEHLEVELRQTLAAHRLLIDGRRGSETDDPAGHRTTIGDGVEHGYECTHGFEPDLELVPNGGEIGHIYATANRR